MCRHCMGKTTCGTASLCASAFKDMRQDPHEAMTTPEPLMDLMALQALLEILLCRRRGLGRRQQPRTSRCWVA